MHDGNSNKRGNSAGFCVGFIVLQMAERNDFSFFLKGFNDTRH
jgi:hypothetical protein